LAIAAVAQAPTAAQTGPTAASLITKMFAHYAGSKSVAGTVRMVQTAMNQSLEIDSTLAYERPSLFYLSQKQSDGKRPPTEIVSDGIEVAYSIRPRIETTTQKVRESVHPKGLKELITPDFYHLISLGPNLDKCLPLNVAVASIDDLRYVRAQLLSFTLGNLESVNGANAYRIDGNWTQDPTHPAEGMFSMWINDAGDLVRFSTKMSFKVGADWLIKHKLPATAYPNGVSVDTVWDVNLKVDVPVNHEVFKLEKI